MKYLLFFLCVVMLKYIFYREGLYNKNDLSVSNSIPNMNSLTDKGVTTEGLLGKANKVNPNILDRQISAININDIPLFYK